MRANFFAEKPRAAVSGPRSGQDAFKDAHEGGVWTVGLSGTALGLWRSRRRGPGRCAARIGARPSCAAPKKTAAGNAVRRFEKAWPKAVLPILVLGLAGLLGLDHQQRDEHGRKPEQHHKPGEIEFHGEPPEMFL
jgi:hypothetical protein